MSHAHAHDAEGAAAPRMRRVLKDAGLRVTGPRVAVMQRLYEAPAPLSHAELVDQLAASGFDRATVYRNLTQLTDAGLVRRADWGDHVWRFELVAREGAQTHDHPHFVCTLCGTRSCLDGVEVRIETTTGAVVPRVNEVVLRGVCGVCAGRAGEA